MIEPILFSASHVAKWDASTTLGLPGPVSRRSNSSSGSDEGEREREATSIPKSSSECRHTTGDSDSHGRVMPVKTYTWITLWFLLTTPVILWDAGYCFMRPRSMRGGDLHWLWKPYALYQDIDYVYGLKALEENNGFTNAQSLLNLIETTLNLTYLYLAHLTHNPSAPLIGFTSATMTLSKTVLYWAQEFYCGGCAIGHNEWKTLVLLWVIPNGLWIVVPSVIVYRLGRDISSALVAWEKSNVKKATGKVL